jgi:hypothetical protein
VPMHLSSICACDQYMTKQSWFPCTVFSISTCVWSCVQELEEVGGLEELEKELARINRSL